MSTPERAAPEGGAGLAGVKQLLGKKVAGIPVLFLVLAAAAAGLYMLHKRGAASTTATDATGDPSTATDYASAGGTLDPGGVSGLDPSGGRYGGGGASFDPTGATGGSGTMDPGALSDAIAGGVAAGVAGIEFPGGNPVTASPAPDPTARLSAPSATDKRRTPAKSRGGQAVAAPAKPHPVVAARGKAKPAATKPAKPPAKAPASRAPGAKRPTAAKPAAPRAPAKSASGKPTRPSQAHH